MNIAAIDIGGTALKAGLFSAEGEMISFSEQPTGAGEGVEALIETVCGIVSGFEGVERVGISTAGQVDPEDGSIVFATESLHGYTGTPLGKILRRRLGVPVAVDNDVRCAAAGEAHFGAGRGLDNFICLTYGTGIGGAIVIGHEIFYGSRGLSGELGHMITHVAGLRCVCGGCGCYEMYASAGALTRRVAEKTGKAMNGREIFAAFGDGAIRAEIDGWIDEIVYGLVSITHAFGPKCFILGGGIMNEPYIISSIGERLNRGVMPSYTPIDVRHAQLGNRAGMTGAFYNALHAEPPLQ